MSDSVPYAAHERALQIIRGKDKEFVWTANNIEPSPMFNMPVMIAHVSPNPTDKTQRYFSITVDWGAENTWGKDNTNIQVASALANIIWDFVSEHREFIDSFSCSFGSGSHNFTLPEEMLAAMRQELRGRGRSEGQASA